MVHGSRRVWQPLEIHFQGPAAHQADVQPNPFLDWRLQVHFSGPSGQVYDVPGFFDGDGLGGVAGDVWEVHFTPDEAGTWQWRVSFRSGPEVAVSLDSGAGQPDPTLDGLQGQVTILPRDPAAPGFLKWGRLEYAGGHYLKFRDGPWFIKTGTNSPENLLAYAGFARPAARPTVHRYAPHRAEWQPGDPDWGASDAQGIVGALNHLAAAGANSVYFLPMNIGGDGQDTWPFVGPVRPGGSPTNDNLHYDMTRMHQWEVVLEHAQELGLLLHVVLNEAEAANKLELDGGSLGVERKLYYRELVARFGHCNALQWNLCEEYDGKLPWSPDTIRLFADWLRAVDPYKHPVTVHQAQDPLVTWTPFLGDARFATTSFQFIRDPLAGRGAEVERWRELTTAAGRPLPICLDEIRRTTPANLDAQRRDILWPTLLSGGHVEFILKPLLLTEDFSPYDPLWRWCAIARGFLERTVPFWTMEPDDALVGGVAGAQCLAEAGRRYVLYLPAGGQATLDLTAAAPGSNFRLSWFDPREELFLPGGFLPGGGVTALGTPPVGEDVAAWVVDTALGDDVPPEVSLAVTTTATRITLRDEDGASDLDWETLTFTVDGQDALADLWAGLGTGLTTVSQAGPDTMLLRYAVDLTGSSVAVSIRDAAGLRAGAMRP